LFIFHVPSDCFNHCAPNGSFAIPDFHMAFAVGLWLAFGINRSDVLALRQDTASGADRDDFHFATSFDSISANRPFAVADPDFIIPLPVSASHAAHHAAPGQSGKSPKAIRAKTRRSYSQIAIFPNPSFVIIAHFDARMQFPDKA
jgi:hypothetical protein